MTILTLSADLNGTLDTTLLTPQPLNVSNNAITYQKIQLIGTARLLGNPTLNSENVSEITLGTSLYFKNNSQLAHSGLTQDIIVNPDSTISTFYGKTHEVFSSVFANQNDFYVSNLENSNVLYLNSSAFISVSGISTGISGKELLIINNGTTPIKFLQNSTLSISTNRFNLNKNIYLNPNECITLRYTNLNSWDILSNSKNYDSEYFGTGYDGDFTLTTGTLTLSRDMYWRNLTLAGGHLLSNGWKINVSEVLDLSNAITNNIMFTDINSLTSSNLTLGSANGNTVGGGGSAISVGTTGNQSYGQNGGLGGGCLGTQLQPVPVYRYISDLNVGILGGCGGAESKIGASGCGGGVIHINAKYINKGNNSVQSIINSQGGIGFNAGGGGWIYIANEYSWGNTITNALSANGGLSSSNKGNNGTGGRITFLNVLSNNISETVGTSINCTQNL